ncbi:MAG: DUF4398 domain-containing protein [Porticoccaceae bacterium]
MTATTQLLKGKQDRGSFLRVATAVVGLLTLAACASAPQPPNLALQAAEIAIANAEQARIADYASPELSQAREKLTAARAAVQREEMVIAQRLAEQSRVDAELAAAKSALVKAGTVNDEMQKGTDTLKQEMQRNPGVQ